MKGPSLCQRSDQTDSFNQSHGRGLHRLRAASAASQRSNFRELWAYRELLYFLTWRDVLVRYKQAVLGVAWAVLQPLLTMVVFTLVFNKGAGVRAPTPTCRTRSSASPASCRGSSSPGRSSRSGVSLVGNANLLTKVYFPRLVIPISAVLAGLVDLGISFVVLLV